MPRRMGILARLTTARHSSSLSLRAEGRCAPYSQKAEGVGFEPTVRFCRTHALQACTFVHSVIPPMGAGILAQGINPTGMAGRLCRKNSALQTLDQVLTLSNDS